MAYSSEFDYVATITIDHTKCGASDSTNFPFLFSGTYAGGAGVPDLRTIANGGNLYNSNGYDIKFTSDSAGLTLLNSEVESYTASTGAVVLWIEIPTLSHTVDTVIYMWFGNPGIQAAITSSVFDSTFAFAAHESTGSPNLDSSASPVAISSHNQTSGTGQVDGCGTYASQNQNWNNGTKLRITPNLTLSAWVKPTGVATPAQAVIYMNSSYGFVIGQTHSGDLAFFNSSTTKATTAGSHVASGSWQHIAVTHDGSNDLFYVNGSLVDTIADSQALGTSSNNLFVGQIQGGFSSYAGSIDEVRVSNVVRSADWLLLEYNNQNNPSSFVTVGAPSAATFTPQWTPSVVTPPIGLGLSRTGPFQLDPYGNIIPGTLPGSGQQVFT